MSKLNWNRILKDKIAAGRLWHELGHIDHARLEEGIDRKPYGMNPLITFEHKDGQGNLASCGINILAGK